MACSAFLMPHNPSVCHRVCAHGFYQNGACNDNSKTNPPCCSEELAVRLFPETGKPEKPTPQRIQDETDFSLGKISSTEFFQRVSDNHPSRR